MKERYKIKIEPLTAVHIGTGNTLTLLDYKLAKTSSGLRKYVRFSSDSILNRIAKDEKLSKDFESFSVKSDMKAIQNFFHQNMKNEDVLYLCLPTEDFKNKYDINKTKDPLQNACEVHEIYRNATTHFPAIPGSSIKGAIRTALLDKCKEDMGNFDFEKEKRNRAFENKILGNKDAKNDPFRAIRIGDCNFNTPHTQAVGSMQIINKKDSLLTESNSTQVLAEVVLGSLVSKEAAAQDFTITIDSDLQKSGATSTKFFMNDIINECNYFYPEALKQEYEHFYKNADSEKIELIDTLLSKVEKITKEENSFVIRVGRWSQFEFVTLYDKNHEFGNSRTVFNYDGQYLPMGWCKCTVEKQ